MKNNHGENVPYCILFKICLVPDCKGSVQNVLFNDNIWLEHPLNLVNFGVVLYLFKIY